MDCDHDELFSFMLLFYSTIAVSIYHVTKPCDAISHILDEEQKIYVTYDFFSFYNSMAFSCRFSKLRQMFYVRYCQIQEKH